MNDEFAPDVDDISPIDSGSDHPPSSVVIVASSSATSSSSMITSFCNKPTLHCVARRESVRKLLARRQSTVVWSLREWRPCRAMTRDAMTCSESRMTTDHPSRTSCPMTDCSRRCARARAWDAAHHHHTRKHCLSLHEVRRCRSWKWTRWRCCDAGAMVVVVGRTERRICLTSSCQRNRTPIRRYIQPSGRERLAVTVTFARGLAFRCPTTCARYRKGS